MCPLFGALTHGRPPCVLPLPFGAGPASHCERTVHRDQVPVTNCVTSLWTTDRSRDECPAQKQV
jgi:hypothetical protein